MNQSNLVDTKDKVQQVQLLTARTLTSCTIPASNGMACTESTSGPFRCNRYSGIKLTNREIRRSVQIMTLWRYLSPRMTCHKDNSSGHRLSTGKPSRFKQTVSDIDE